MEHGAAAAGGYLFSFGGISNNSIVANAYKFDGSVWESIAPLPEPLINMGVVSDGSFIYIIGGSQNVVNARNTLYRYDPAANTYTALAPANLATKGSGTVFLDGKIYKIAGFPVNAVTKAVEVYTVATDNWQAAADYPASLGDIGCFAQDGFVYCAGGQAFSGEKSAATYRYDPNQDSWSDSAMADLPAPRWKAAAFRYNGMPVLAGGSVADFVSSSAITWSAANNTWTALENLPKARYKTAGAVVDEKVCVIGGSTPEGGFVGSNEVQAYACPATYARITGVALDGASYSVTFEALAQRTYRIERATSLVSADFETIEGVADYDSPSGGFGQFSDPSALEQDRAFYRVRLLP